MRLTNQTNLNLDTTNLLAHKDKKVNKLYYQLCNYPAELVPVMDTGLMDMMIEVAAEDKAKGDESMQGDLGEEEIRAIQTALYKVRPFGAEKMVNMRDLNPNGQLDSFFFALSSDSFQS
jgi:DNA replication licensing factor MCM4